MAADLTVGTSQVDLLLALEEQSKRKGRASPRFLRRSFYTIHIANQRSGASGESVSAISMEVMKATLPCIVITYPWRI